MAKAQKDTNFLISSAGTGFFYTNRKNRKKSKGEKKLSVKKYDPVIRKHVLFEEKKLSKLKVGRKVIMKVTIFVTLIGDASVVVITEKPLLVIQLLWR